jgi:hypothetical protein
MQVSARGMTSRGTKVPPSPTNVTTDPRIPSPFNMAISLWFKARIDDFARCGYGEGLATPLRDSDNR